MCIAICTTSIFKAISIPLPCPPSVHLHRGLCHLHYVFFFFLFSVIFSVPSIYLTASIAPPHAQAMERLNVLNSDSSQPFPGPLQIVARLCFCFFLLFPFFSDTIFFQLGTRVRVWQVCHGGPRSLFVYHSWL